MIIIIVVILEWSVNQGRDLDPDLIMSDLIKYQRPTLCLLHIDDAGDDDDDHDYDHQNHQHHHIITYVRKNASQRYAIE